MTERSNGDQLLSPSEAVRRIAEHVGSQFQARQIIADALHSGDLVASADAIWEISDIDPTDPWPTLLENATSLGSDVELQPDSWQASYCWPEEVRYWRWKEGNFLVNLSENPIEMFSGIALENVSLERRAVMSLVGRTDRTGSGGRKVDKERWSEFWINFLYDCAGDLCDWSQFENKHQLKQAMLGSSPDLFADSNVEPKIVDLAWNGLVARQARERLARAETS